MTYAATAGLDEIAMYLSLRAKDNDEQNSEGKNIFLIYLLKQDILRCM